MSQLVVAFRILTPVPNVGVPLLIAEFVLVAA